MISVFCLSRVLQSLIELQAKTLELPTALRSPRVLEGSI